MKKLFLLSLLSLGVLAGCSQSPSTSQNVTQETGSVSAKISTSGAVSLLDIVASHADATSCWTVISGSVYDLTSFIGKHPGGDKAILASCGNDATNRFDEKHGMDPKKWEGLKSFKVMVK